MRVIGSANADPYSALAGAMGALYGPLHGGANEAAMDMLAEIMEAVDGGSTPKAWLDNAFETKRKLMGFGHRVYKNFDPRAKVMKQAADEVLAELGIEDENLEIAKRLEEIALKDEYFIEKKLYPNIDFYSGIILFALISEIFHSDYLVVGWEQGYCHACYDAAQTDIE